eukprot:g2863.t1
MPAFRTSGWYLSVCLTVVEAVFHTSGYVGMVILSKRLMTDTLPFPLFLIVTDQLLCYWAMNPKAEQAWRTQHLPVHLLLNQWSGTMPSMRPLVFEDHDLPQHPQLPRPPGRDDACSVPLSVLVQGKKQLRSLPVALSLIPLSVGGCLSSAGEVNFDAFGMALAVCALAFRAGRMLFTSLVVERRSAELAAEVYQEPPAPAPLDEAEMKALQRRVVLDLAALALPVNLISMLFLSALFEGHQPWKRLYEIGSKHLLFLILAKGLCAASWYATEFLLIERRGAVFTSIMANLNRVCCIATGLWVFRNPVSALQGVGFGLTLLGLGAYLRATSSLPSIPSEQGKTFRLTLRSAVSGDLLGAPGGGDFRLREWDAKSTTVRKVREAVASAPNPAAAQEDNSRREAANHSEPTSRDSVGSFSSEGYLFDMDLPLEDDGGQALLCDALHVRGAREVQSDTEMANAGAALEAKYFVRTFEPFSSKEDVQKALALWVLEEAARRWVDAEPGLTGAVATQYKALQREQRDIEEKYGPVRIWDLSALSNLNWLMPRCGAVAMNKGLGERYRVRDLLERVLPGDQLSRLLQLFTADVSGWDVSGATHLEGMFQGCEKFNCDIAAWDVSKVANFSSMFSGCKEFDQNLAAWSVGNGVDFFGMFESCKKFDQDLASWNVAKGVRFSFMFRNCEKFDQDLASWNVANGVHFSAMFFGCRLFNRNLDPWDVAKAETMQAMFCRCDAFSQPLASWQVGRVADFSDMFDDCASFSQDVSSWNVNETASLRGIVLRSILTCYPRRMRYIVRAQGGAVSETCFASLHAGRHGERWGKHALANATVVELTVESTSRSVCVGCRFADDWEWTRLRRVVTAAAAAADSSSPAAVYSRDEDIFLSQAFAESIGIPVGSVVSSVKPVYSHQLPHTAKEIHVKALHANDFELLDANAEWICDNLRGQIGVLTRETSFFPVFLHGTTVVKLEVVKLVAAGGADSAPGSSSAPAPLKTSSTGAFGDVLRLTAETDLIIEGREQGRAAALNADAEVRTLLLRVAHISAFVEEMQPASVLTLSKRSLVGTNSSDETDGGLALVDIDEYDGDFTSPRIASRKLALHPRMFRSIFDPTYADPFVPARFVETASQAVAIRGHLHAHPPASSSKKFVQYSGARDSLLRLNLSAADRQEHGLYSPSSSVCQQGSGGGSLFNQSCRNFAADKTLLWVNGEVFQCVPEASIVRLGDCHVLNYNCASEYTATARAPVLGGLLVARYDPRQLSVEVPVIRLTLQLPCGKNRYKEPHLAEGGGYGGGQKDTSRKKTKRPLTDADFRVPQTPATVDYGSTADAENPFDDGVQETSSENDHHLPRIAEIAGEVDAAFSRFLMQQEGGVILQQGMTLTLRTPEPLESKESAGMIAGGSTAAAAEEGRNAQQSGAGGRINLINASASENEDDDCGSLYNCDLSSETSVTQIELEALAEAVAVAEPPNNSNSSMKTEVTEKLEVNSAPAEDPWVRLQLEAAAGWGDLQVDVEFGNEDDVDVEDDENAERRTNASALSSLSTRTLFEELFADADAATRALALDAVDLVVVSEPGGGVISSPEGLQDQGPAKIAAATSLSFFRPSKTAMRKAVAAQFRYESAGLLVTGARGSWKERILKRATQIWVQCPLLANAKVPFKVVMDVLRTVFIAASELGPCIVVLQEVDALLLEGGAGEDSQNAQQTTVSGLRSRCLAEVLRDFLPVMGGSCAEHSPWALPNAKTLHSRIMDAHELELGSKSKQGEAPTKGAKNSASSTSAAGAVPTPVTSESGDTEHGLATYYSEMRDGSWLPRSRRVAIAATATSENFRNPFASLLDSRVHVRNPSLRDRVSLLTHFFFSCRRGTRRGPSPCSSSSEAATTNMMNLVDDLAARTDGLAVADLDEVAELYRAVEKNKRKAVSAEQLIELFSKARAASSSSFSSSSTGGSKAQRLDSDAVTWAHVGGLRTQKKVLLDTLLLPTTFEPLLRRSPVRPRQGLVLLGPSGCGKTYLVHALSNRLRGFVRFFQVKGPELLSKYIGESEAGVRAVFEQAKQCSPSCIFFDEIEALCPVRGGETTGVTDRVVNQMLTYLDGVEARKQLFVIAATARPDLVDPALLRPGRFDRKLYCGPPGADLDEWRGVVAGVMHEFEIAAAGGPRGGGSKSSQMCAQFSRLRS